MSEHRPTKRIRDADRTREAILDAAEALFAQKGYEATSLQEIGDRAGVSRGTPNYFFGSKEQLYHAVLERVLAAERTTVLEPQDHAGSEEELSEVSIAAAIGRFFDFLIARPTFLQLMEREALSGGQRLRDIRSYPVTLQQGQALFDAAAKQGAIRPVDSAQMLLSITALCWFPLVHAETFTRMLGLDADDPAFLQQRKQHIIELVLRSIRNT
jgi:AcrR family transcriptional regulator